MIILIVFIFVCPVAIKAIHFNGGTINWSPVDPYTNSSEVVIVITQTYSWVLSNVNCDVNVPISTSSWSNGNTNLACTGNCSNDGNYSQKPVNILTDCISSSSSLDMMKSQQSKNVTLTIGAYFRIAYRGSDWRHLDFSNGSSARRWSVVSLIDLRRRPDGILNTPPVSNVASPQYVIANRTTPIKIPVSDVNDGDDIRCRWAEKNR